VGGLEVVHIVYVVKGCLLVSFGLMLHLLFAMNLTVHAKFNVENITVVCRVCLQVEIMNSNPAAGRQNNLKPRQPRSVGMGVMAGPGPRGSGYPLR